VTKTATSSVFRTWRKRVEGGVFTKAQCNRWAKAGSRLAFGDEIPKWSDPGNLTDDEAKQIQVLIRLAGGMRLTEEHDRQGREWLKRYGVKILGVTSEMVDTIDHFTYDGLNRQSRPVWTVHTTDGRKWRYYSMAWQAGSQREQSDWWWA
jgi:hypothetical protein